MRSHDETVLMAAHQPTLPITNSFRYFTEKEAGGGIKRPQHTTFLFLVSKGDKADDNDTSCFLSLNFRFCFY